jgi:8-oxo-dGTP pyrophosphatase MutT (NUDIX family)
LTDLPEFLLEDARRFYASGAAPVLPKPAATVLLLRDPLQVYLMRRAQTMAFAPGMHVFPGGTVDARDAAADVRWIGPDPAQWSQRLGLAPAAAQAVVCAAVREVFEECAVLLAGSDASSVVGDVSTSAWQRARAAVEAREIGFADLLREHGLALRADLLAPWSRWITPEFEPRRFDTFFFLARLPAGQRTLQVGSEATESVWLPPDQAVRLPMLPPTRLTLGDLATFSTVDQAVAAAADRDAAKPIEPRLVDGKLAI